MRDGRSPSPTRAERRDQATEQTRLSILAAARDCLLAEGYAGLSTRRVAEAAEVPLSQIHYHFGTKQQLILEVLAAENARLLERQRGLFDGDQPLWRQWEQACTYLDDDLRSGYVRVLNELVAAGWSDPTLAAAVRELIGGWFRLLGDVANRVVDRGGDLGPFTPAEIGALMALPFVGAEPMLLLGFDDEAIPARSALRKVGAVIRLFEEGTMSMPQEDAP
jgi:AcrR family transcriptional regulator